MTVHVCAAIEAKGWAYDSMAYRYIAAQSVPGDRRVLLLGGWGYWALRTVPIDAIPDLSDNQVIVFTDWPGRSPQEVEDQITYPLTVGLQGLPGVRVVLLLGVWLLDD